MAARWLFFYSKANISRGWVKDVPFYFMSAGAGQHRSLNAGEEDICSVVTI